MVKVNYILLYILLVVVLATTQYTSATTPVTTPTSTYLCNDASNCCQSHSDVIINIEQIGFHAFDGCVFSNVIFSSSVKVIGEASFMGATVTSKTLIIPGNVERIEKAAFQWSNIETIVIEEGVQYIEDQIFYESRLIDLTLPNSLITMDPTYTFYGTNLNCIHSTNYQIVVSILNFPLCPTPAPSTSPTVASNTIPTTSPTVPTYSAVNTTWIQKGDVYGKIALQPSVAPTYTPTLSINTQEWDQWNVVTALNFSQWTGVASDSTGRYIVACSPQLGIFVSANFGNSWNLTNKLQYCSSVTSDTTGAHLVVSVYVLPYQVYVSSNYGSTWASISSPNISNQVWQVASDSTGQYLIAASGMILLSSDYGSSWAGVVGDNFWFAASSDSTGVYLGAMGKTTQWPSSLYLSSNSGIDWFNIPTSIIPILPNQTAFSWGRLVIVGQSLAVTVPNIGIFISSNFGTTWTSFLIPSVILTGIVADSTFTVLLAGSQGGSIYWSSSGIYSLKVILTIVTILQGGGTWFRSASPVSNWYALTLSSSGTFLVAGCMDYYNSGFVYTSTLSLSTLQPSLQPTISPTPVTSNSLLTSSPFSRQTWSFASIKLRIQYYYLTYAIYFILFYIILLLAKYIPPFQSISDQLYECVKTSDVFDKLKTLQYDDNKPICLKEYITQRDSSFIINKCNRIDDDNINDFKVYGYIINTNSFFNCKQIWTYTWFESGSIEDYIFFIFNHHRYLKCFCSINIPPLTLRSKRAILILNTSILFIIITIINDVLIFHLGFTSSNTVTIFFWITYHLGNEIFSLY